MIYHGVSGPISGKLPAFSEEPLHNFTDFLLVDINAFTLSLLFFWSIQHDEKSPDNLL